MTVEEGRGASARWKEFAKPESKKYSRVSSARTSMRKVGRVMCTGLEGSRAALAAVTSGFLVWPKVLCEGLASMLSSAADGDVTSAGFSSVSGSSGFSSSSFKSMRSSPSSSSSSSRANLSRSSVASFSPCRDG